MKHELEHELNITDQPLRLDGVEPLPEPLTEPSSTPYSDPFFDAARCRRLWIAVWISAYHDARASKPKLRAEARHFLYSGFGQVIAGWAGIKNPRQHLLRLIGPADTRR